MTETILRYDKMVEDALRSVVRSSLEFVVENGIPEDHHFYITFDTTAEGVALPDALLEKHPEEMTIVLQHQFWDLKVNEDYFEVSLSFSGIPRRMVVPLAAVTAFFDPSVQFGLKFEVADPADADATPREPAANVDDAVTEDISDTESSAEVVTLDAFRKK